MPNRKRLFSPVVLLLLLVAPLGAEESPFAKIRQEIEKELQENNVPSLAVAVIKDGKILWEEGFGWASREQKIRATEQTMYSLA